MKFLFGIIFLSSSLFSFSQVSNFKIYTLEEALLVSPDSVFSIDLSRQKLFELPKELFRFTSLKTLNLSKNKLSKLEGDLSLLNQLEKIDISSNKFESLPAVLFQLGKLQTLIAAKNEILKIQDEIQYLQSLREIDLYDNPVSDIGSGLTKLKNLEKLDLRGVMYGPTFHQFILSSLPNSLVKMDPPCTCME